ncbi:hypothetical protein DFJ77DRAFT_427654, partial [Powellomyces hirtus]
QFEALAPGRSAYYWNVMLCQMFNLFACNTRYRKPFGRYQFRSSKTFACVLCGGLFTTIIKNYIQPVAFATSYHMLPLFWLSGFLGGSLVIMYSALRKLIVRKYFPVLRNKDIDGLMMHPTRWVSIGVPSLSFGDG